MTNDSSPKGAPKSQHSRKRKIFENEDEKQSLNVKKAKLWQVKLESESSTSSDKEESVHSIQEYDTDLACDTSDTSTHTLITGSGSDISIHIEYELDSPPADEKQIAFASSDSCSLAEDIVINIVNVSETEGLADNSDDSSCSLDYVIKSDFRYCALCRNLNTNPLYSSCLKCFKIKKNNQVNRPKPKARGRVNKKNSHFSKTEPKPQCSHNAPKQAKNESQIKSGVNNNKDLDSSTKSSNPELANAQPDTENNSTAVVSMPNTTSESKKETQTTNNLCNKCNNCNICIERPKNGIFIHGKSAHIFSCYECAVKIWKTNGHRCPLCKTKVPKVIKAFCS